MFRRAFSIGLLVCGSALAQPLVPVHAQEARTQVPVVTRLVQLYSEYERRLAEAINRRDNGELDQLLAKDFELRSADNIGVPVPRAEWIAQAFKQPAATTSIRQMAVHDYGDIRVVSFVILRSERPRREPLLAVVDVWMQSGESSVLKVRYAADQTDQRYVPGKTRQRVLEKRH
jgi:Domain of unknown function (DUF4440)